MKNCLSLWFLLRFREKLREAIQGNLARQLRHVAEFFQIRGWLEKEGITVIPYKGFWLGEAMYGNLAERESFDTDLFIDLFDLEKITSIMTGRGYILQESLLRFTDQYVFNELAECNFDKYSRDVRISHLEFHWRSSMTFYRMDIGFDELRSQIISGRIQDNTLNVFSAAANLLLAVMHHGGKECFIRLRQILDIAQIIRKNPDLDTEWLFRQAERYHIKSLVCVGIRLASELTGVDIPQTLIKSANKRRIVRLAKSTVRLTARPVSRLATYKDGLRGWFFKIRSRDGFKMKAHFFYYTLRKIVAPRLVPEKWRHIFFNRKIIIKPATVNGV